jgi:DNA-binding CsgD family transcriptional regulator
LRAAHDWSRPDCLGVHHSGVLRGIFCGRHLVIGFGVAVIAAKLAFMGLLEERFAEWALSPAERDVALFAIKGMSTAEIGSLRNTSEGTVKAQTNAIYRKAGVTGRPQLLSVFIEDLMRDDSATRLAAEPQSAA